MLLDGCFCALQAAQNFTVGLQDYYGHLGINDNSGQCQVVYNGTDITLPQLGKVVDIRKGQATFQQFSILGELPV